MFSIEIVKFSLKRSSSFLFLCLPYYPDYFAKHMGDYEGVLASLETLNLSILKAMDFTKKVSGASAN